MLSLSEKQPSPAISCLPLLHFTSTVRFLSPTPLLDSYPVSVLNHKPLAMLHFPTADVMRHKKSCVIKGYSLVCDSGTAVRSHYEPITVLIRKETAGRRGKECSAPPPTAQVTPERKQKPLHMAEEVTWKVILLWGT